jgi:hypothetical protein
MTSSPFKLGTQWLLMAKPVLIYVLLQLQETLQFPPNVDFQR